MVEHSIVFSIGGGITTKSLGLSIRPIVVAVNVSGDKPIAKTNNTRLTVRTLSLMGDQGQIFQILFVHSLATTLELYQDPPRNIRSTPSS